MKSAVSIYLVLTFVFVLGGACPIDDPLFVNQTTLEIDLSPLIVIHAGSNQRGGVITGMVSLTTDAPYNLITSTLHFNLTLKHANLAGTYHNASGIINAGPFLPEILPSGPFTAIGDSTGSVSDFVVVGRAVLFINLITLRISVRTLIVDTFSFSDFKLNLGDVVVAGVPMDWQTWNDNFMANWERNYAANKLQLVDYIRVSANAKLQDFTLQDFLDFILRPC